jgi:alcohol dehydrogenase (cytochrome c)
MKLLKNALVLAAFVLFLTISCSLSVRAQDLETGQLLNPAPDTWPQYHGDYSGRRHIHLTQITQQNVGDLTLAWAYQTNQGAEIKSSPLLVDGVLYFTVPDSVWAVDARSGHMIWHYNRPSTGEHIGHRGVAMYKGWLYFTTPDAHLISLDAKDGKVRWDKIIADANKGYWTTMAPLVVKGHVIVGVSGDFDNLPGYLRSFDPESGSIQWQWDATPPCGKPQRDHRWHDMDDGDVRSRFEPCVLGNGESDAGSEWNDATWRQSIHVQHCRH